MVGYIIILLDQKQRYSQGLSQCCWYIDDDARQSDDMTMMEDSVSGSKNACL